MKSYVIISNGGGGIATFQQYLIKNILRNKGEIFLIDKKNCHTEKFLKKKEKKNIKICYCNAIYEPKKVNNYLNLIRKKTPKNEIIFIFSNPLLLILYIFFIKIKFDNSKIYSFMHSHILKLSFSQILIGFLSSLISLFINKVYFVSKFTRNWWFKYFFIYKFTNYKICHNSIQLPKMSKGRLKANKVGFVGRLEKEKGIHFFLEIEKYMRGSEFSFKIFGEGSFERKIAKDKNINLNKWTSQKIIYKAIDILLVTSPVENCPYTVLEAKSYGIPTLSISRGGIKEILKNNNDGIILKENSDYEKISKALLYIKKNIKRFSKNCIKNRINFKDKINFLALLKDMQ